MKFSHGRYYVRNPLIFAQFDFSYYVTGFISGNFDQQQRDEVCSTLLEAVQLYNARCVIGEVVTIDPNYPGVVQVNGYVVYEFYSVPSALDLALAEVNRNNAVAALTTTTEFPTLSGDLNCECKGFYMPDKSPVNTTVFQYENIPGILGPGQCASKLLGDGTVNAVVGIDISPDNYMKFCSDPPIPGGVTGTPGATPGTCRIFGVTNDLCLPSEPGENAALDDNSEGTGGTWGVRNDLTPKIESHGAGYITAPEVYIDPPLWERAVGVQITNLNTSGSVCDGPDDPTNQCGIAPGSLPSGYGYDPENPPSYKVYHVGNRVEECEDGTVSIGQTETADAGRIIDIALPQACAINGSIVDYTAYLVIDSPPPQQNATAISLIEGGQVVSIIVTDPGFYKFSGPYSGEIGWSIDPPDCGGDSGKLCSTDLSVQLMDPQKVIITPLDELPDDDPESMCRAISINTLSSKVCSSPSLTALDDSMVMFGEPAFGNCGVLSSFRAEPSSLQTYRCGVIPQGFNSTIVPEPTDTPTPSPTPPPPTPTPTPSPTPSPTPEPTTTPSPTPSPTPEPTTTPCSPWIGTYTFESVHCPGRYLAFPFNCYDTIVRFGSQKTYPRGRTNWTLNAEPNTFTNIRADRNCLKTILASNTRPSLGSGIITWQYKLESTPGDCNVVSMQAKSGQQAGKHLGVLTDCSGFFWRKYGTGALATWRLKQV